MQKTPILEHFASKGTRIDDLEHDIIEVRLVGSYIASHECPPNIYSIIECKTIGLT